LTEGSPKNNSHYYWPANVTFTGYTTKYIQTIYRG